MNKYLLRFAALPLFLAPLPAVAQTSPTAAQAPQWVGKPVVDTAGNPVGTVQAFADGNFVVKTDRLEARLPLNSFTLQEGKLYFGMTQAQLNQAVEQRVAANQASLAAGASVRGSGGSVVGTIEAIDEQFVTLKLNSGKSIRIPRNGIAGRADGAVIGMTAEALEAAASGSTTPANGQ